LNRYHAFGLSIVSDLPLPELLAEETPNSPVDLRIRERRSGVVSQAEQEAPASANGNGLTYDFFVPGVADFRVENGTDISFARATPEVNDAVIRVYLLGSGIGCALQQRGYVVLHGNAVTTDGKTCRIVVGHSGAGKSTSAGLAYTEGDRILADDVCAISLDDDGTGWVHPAYPQIKLWKRSADLLGIPTKGLRKVHPAEEKYALPIRERYWRTPLPLAEVIELSAENATEDLIRGFDKARCLAEHSYRNWFLSSMGLEAEYMKKLMKLVTRVKVRRGMRADLVVRRPVGTASEDPDR
jgi:hypothetical protein